MTTQAQTRTANYVCYVTWQGGDSLPVAPDATYTFVETTGMTPLPEAGDVYNPATQTWSTPPPS
jgi:hypothetical protein